MFILTLVAWFILVESSYGHECGTYLEHLVSGPNAVPDKSITSSSRSWNSAVDHHDAKYGRLYHFTRSPIKSAGWTADPNDKNPYIQVDFNRPVVVCAVQTQGRHNHYQWTKSFEVLYSSDGSTWHNVKNAEHNSVFAGNSNHRTVVRRNFEKCVQANLMRINPKTFHAKVSLRMDLLGCSKKRRDLFAVKSKNKFKVWKRTPLNKEITDRISSHLEPHVGSCAIACQKTRQCVNYVFNPSIKSCVLLPVGNYKSTVKDASTSFIYSIVTGYLPYDADAYDYKSKSVTTQDENVYYKIITEKKTKSDASQICADDDARLLILKAADIMASIQDDIKKSLILAQESEYYIDGNYKGGKWSFGTGEEVPTGLWASSFTLDDSDNCIVVTATGLKTNNCNSPLFFVCEMWLKHA